MEPTTRQLIRADRRAVLSSLWIFVLFNMLFRDIHEFARPGAIEEFMAMEVDDMILVAAGMALTVFISMIVVNRVLPSTPARWANVTVGLAAIASMIAMPPGDSDDMWFFAVEVLALVAIIGIGWTWRTDHIDRSDVAVVSTAG